MRLTPTMWCHSQSVSPGSVCAPLSIAKLEVVLKTCAPSGTPPSGYGTGVPTWVGGGGLEGDDGHASTPRGLAPDGARL